VGLLVGEGIDVLHPIFVYKKWAQSSADAARCIGVFPHPVQVDAQAVRALPSPFARCDDFSQRASV